MIDIRPLTALPDLKEAVRLQQVIWGFEEIELIPLRLFVVATKVGGHAFGGFDGKRMPLCGRNCADSIRWMLSCTISLNSLR